MFIFKKLFKNIGPITFVIIFIFFSTLQAKNLEKFNKAEKIADYFSGILLLHDSQYEESNKFLQRLDGLELNHINYSSKFLYSLVNSGKFEEAFKFSKKLERRNIDNFESNLVLGVYYLKNGQDKQAQKYLLKIKNSNSVFILNKFLSDSLLIWSDVDNKDFFESQTKINALDKRFENLKSIETVFLHCFYKSKKADNQFEKLISNKEVNFSRYNYFYSSYLVETGRVNKAKEVIKSSLELFPRNLLLNQQKIDLNSKREKIDFNCQNKLHVIAEIFYITANALSSQSIFTFSNFYVNLAKYLNSDFYPFNTLIAENFYNIDKLHQAKQVYRNLEKKGEAFMWFAAKQNARILIKEEDKEKAIKDLTKKFLKVKNKNIYTIYEYADFLKSNEQFLKSIEFYTDIINIIDKTHPIFPEALEGRGVSYERIGEWNKAEKDLLASLEIKPDEPYVINYLAYSWIEQGVNIEKSLKMLERANKLRSNDPYIIDSLGWALFKLNRYKEAKDYLKLAVQLLPADPIVSDHYGDALWKNGEEIQARYYWNYVLNLKETKKELKDIIKNKLILGL